MRVSLLPHEFASVPESADVADFSALVALIGSPQPASSKRGLPLYSPAEWPTGAAKRKNGVLRVHFGVLDLDDVTEQDLVEVLGGLACPYLLVSSWSHGSQPGKARARLLVPFSRPVEASEWLTFWPYLSGVLGRHRADPACSDASRCYWFPFHPENPPAEPLYIHDPSGEPIDVDEVLGASPSTSSTSSTSSAPGATHLVSREQLADLAAKKRRSRSPSVKALGEMLEKVLSGDPFAEEGHRDNALYKLCCAIAEAHPHADPESVADLFEPSLHIMQVLSPEGALGRRHVLEKLERKAKEPREALAGRIADVWAGRRAGAYSAEELESFSDQLGATSMRGRWIVQRGRSYYLWAGVLEDDGTCLEGRYRGPFGGDDVQNAARRLLSPAQSAGVVFDVVTEKSTRPKSAFELVRDYGIVAESVRVDLTADFSYYDAEADTFTEAPCPLRRLEPRYDPDIARWLEELAGPEHLSALEAWIAAATLLHEPCAALYLEGKRGTGKSLLAMGLARLWTEQGPTDLEEALAQFNESILGCPLVFGDEVVPKDWRGRAKTGEIREFVQARVRSLKRKHVATAKVYGCVRLILAANNREMLSSKGDETNNDIEAIVERFYHLPVRQEAAEYLASLPREKVGAWVTQDLLARHALYLRDTVPVVRSGRFLVSGHASELIRQMQSASGLRGALCHWLVSFLLDPSRLAQSTNRSLLRTHEGALCVNSRIVIEHWSSYTTHEEPPTANRLNQALTGISCRRVHLRDAKGHETWYRVVDTDVLSTWAEATGYATRETIETILSRGL